MTVELAELHDELRAVARELLGRTTAQEAEWSRIAEAGWVGLEVPDELEGSGATFAEVAVVLEEMGRAATASPYLGTAVLGVGALCSVAADPVRDALLRRAASGEVRLAVAIASSGDAAAPSPAFRLERSGGDIRLHGHASFVADAAEADRLLVLALDADGATMLVGLDPSTLTVRAQPVVDRTGRFASVDADAVEVASASVWAFDGHGQDLFDRASAAVACDSLGLGHAMLDATVAYVGARRQFDRPIGSFQAVKHQCTDMLVQLTLGRELLRGAVEAVVAGSPERGAAVAMAKSFVCDAAVDVVGTAMQLHGGIGYTWESGIHVYLKRATRNRSLFGSTRAHRRRLADAFMR